MEEKNAICFYGGVSQKSDNYKGGVIKSEINRFINYAKIAEVNKKHIIEINPVTDIFIHCWNKSLEEGMVKCYNPKSYLFEDNSTYVDELDSLCFTKNNQARRGKEFNRNSFFLTINKSINLMLEYAKQNNIIYNNILVYRPDIVLKKDFKLNQTTKPNTIISNHNNGHPGDFFFLMDMEASKKFASIYNSLNSSIEHNLWWMPKDLSIQKGLKFEMEEKIQTPKDIELARRIGSFK